MSKLNNFLERTIFEWMNNNFYVIVFLILLFVFILLIGYTLTISGVI